VDLAQTQRRSNYYDRSLLVSNYTPKIFVQRWEKNRSQISRMNGRTQIMVISPKWTRAAAARRRRVLCIPLVKHGVHTPFNESSVFQYPTPPPPPVASTWDIDPHQPHGEEHLQPLVENMEGGHKMHRLHTSTFFPFFSCQVQ
jgi:hypothetical protein